MVELSKNWPSPAWKPISIAPSWGVSRYIWPRLKPVIFTSASLFSLTAAWINANGSPGRILAARWSIPPGKGKSPGLGNGNLPSGNLPSGNGFGNLPGLGNLPSGNGFGNLPLGNLPSGKGKLPGLGKSLGMLI